MKAVVISQPSSAELLTLADQPDPITLRAREPAFKAALAPELEQEVWTLISAGKFQSHLFETFPFVEAADALRPMESSTHIGNTVLIPTKPAVG